MFSGIVEAQSKILSLEPLPAQQICRIQIERPSFFDDIKNGDSICVNGVCLTIEAFDLAMMQFCLGSETLQLLGAGFAFWQSYPLNLERSLCLGARIHGHLVTGHVDSLAPVVDSYADGECWQLRIGISQELRPYFWKKGSACVNGVSLTVNEITEVDGLALAFCLVPETIAKTNLAHFKKAELINLESDYLAKAYINSCRNQAQFSPQNCRPHQEGKL